MSIIEHLSHYLQANVGATLPEIRYFDGLDSGDGSLPFCTIEGKYRGKSFEDSMKAFMREKLL